MSKEPQARAYPKGLEDESPNGPPTVVVAHRGYELVLRFAPGDFTGKGDVQELLLRPGGKDLRPRLLRQFAPDAETYLAYARAAMRLLGPEGTPESRMEDYRGAAEALRHIAGPGRGLGDEFYRTIATNYKALVDGGEKHPVKALSENHHVTISAASRWLTEARRRGLLKEKSSVG